MLPRISLFYYQKKYLFLAFFSGFVIMATELIATRITAPYIGVSIFTWTAIISMILLGISVGNYFGGRLADKGVSFAPFLITGTMFIAAIPLFAQLTPFITTLHIGLMSIALLVAAFLFLGPAILLGTIYPFVLKQSIASQGLEHVGERAGLLSGLAALGSIAGTFITGFFFIQFFGSSLSLHILALMLLLSSLWFENILSKTIIYGAIGMGMLIASYYVFPFLPRRAILFETESAYYKISVLDRPFHDQPSRILFMDFDSHSIEGLNGARIGTYQDISPIFKVFRKDLHHILTIGSGSYNISKDLYDLYHADITAIEIDPKVTETARMFFHLNAYPLHAVHADGRFFLNTTKDTYDLIFEDAFNSFISMPWYLATKEATEAAKAHLNPRGIYALSVISARTGTDAKLFESIAKTFSLTFPNYYAISLGSNSNNPQNIILVGINASQRINEKDLTMALSDLTKQRNFVFQPTYEYQPSLPANAIVLTDDYAPVERLNASLIKRYLPFYAKWFYSLFDMK